MMRISDVEEQIDLTGTSFQAEVTQVLSAVGLEHPADLRERMKTLLLELPQRARSVYCRETIADPETPLFTVVETVLYHFDAHNRRKVAAALNLDYDLFVMLLEGLVIGVEMTRYTEFMG